MHSKYSFLVIIVVYIIVFVIGLYLIFADKDWRGYVALLSTPLLHTLIKAIDKQVNTRAFGRQAKK